MTQAEYSFQSHKEAFLRQGSVRYASPVREILLIEVLRERFLYITHRVIERTIPKSLYDSSKSKLKGAVSRDFFDIFLFPESKPFGPLINSLKWFCLKN